MVQRRIIPDAYTDYEDGHIGAVPGSLANVEAKIGAAAGETPGRVYTLGGADAKKQARTIFKSGPLLQAIEEAFDAGSTRIHAVRIDQPEQAFLTLKDVSGTDTVRLKGDFGSSGNNHFVNVTHQFQSLDTGYAAVVSGSPHKVVFYSPTFEELRQIPLPADMTQVMGLGVQRLPFNSTGQPEFWVLGVGPGPGNPPIVAHFDQDGILIETDTLDLSSLLPEGDTPTGIAAEPWGPDDGLEVVTDKHLLYLHITQPGTAVVDYALDFAEVGIPTPDISSVVGTTDLNAELRGEHPDTTLCVLDRTAKRIYGITRLNESSPVLLGSVDISTWAGLDSPEGIAIDYDTDDVLVAMRSAAGPQDRGIRLSIDWDGDPAPTVAYVDTHAVAHSVYGLGESLYNCQALTRVTIQDRNEPRWLVRVYQATGTMTTVTSAVVDAINQEGTYRAELLIENPLVLTPSENGEGGGPDPTYFVPFAGGSDGGALTNADYLAGLEATAGRIDTAWIHAVGAVTPALWNAILVHCAEMFERHQAERFAILETPAFVCSAEPGSAAYLETLQEYVDDIVAMAGDVADRNAVIFAGGARFVGSDGVEYTRSVASACGGTMAGLEVQKSLINKPVRNVTGLVPDFGQAHTESLIQAGVNCLRLKPGRGFTIAHSLTAAAPGSDYSRVNDLRAVYYAAKAAREAAQPYVGEENDSAGEGLRRLESAMSRPLESMRDNGQIDAFDLVATSTPQDRILGDVYVKLGIQPRRAMEMIYTTVYLK